jgi:hypothetical protein
LYQICEWSGWEGHAGFGPGRIAALIVFPLAITLMFPFMLAITVPVLVMIALRPAALDINSFAQFLAYMDPHRFARTMSCDSS